MCTLQSEWEKNMQAELVSFGIELFDFEDEVQGEAKGSSSEVDGLACGGWTFWLNTFYLDIGPLGIAFPLYEVPPDHLDRRRDDCDGTDCQAHSVFLLSISGLRQGIIYALRHDNRRDRKEIFVLWKISHLCCALPAWGGRSLVNAT
jgi:hypothetical protein